MGRALPPHCARLGSGQAPTAADTARQAATSSNGYPMPARVRSAWVRQPHDRWNPMPGQAHRPKPARGASSKNFVDQTRPSLHQGRDGSSSPKARQALGPSNHTTTNQRPKRTKKPRQANQRTATLARASSTHLSIACTPSKKPKPRCSASHLSKIAASAPFDSYQTDVHAEHRQVAKTIRTNFTRNPRLCASEPAAVIKKSPRATGPRHGGHAG